MNKKKLFKINLIFLALAAIITIIFVGNYFFDFSLVRNDNGVSASNRNVPSSTAESVQCIIDNNHQIQAEKTNSFINSSNKKDISLISDDNLSLSATEFINNNDSHKFAILVHGYTQNKNYVFDIASHYFENGYTVIAPDLRAHGKSEGKYIGMGWLDKNDILKWISFVIKDDPCAQIVLHGVSMGAATVMMVSGENLPESVCAIVEDCGYTDVSTVFSSELYKRFKLPSFPIINCASLVSKIRAGYDFSEASCINQVKKSTTPILFIHGTNDNFIPVDMCHQLYNVATCKKEKLIINGAGHTQCRFVEPDTYYNTVFNFIDNVK